MARPVFRRNQERWFFTHYHIFTVEDMRHDQRFIVRLSSRTSKRFGRNSDYTSWQTFGSSNASPFTSDNICWNTHNARMLCVFLTSKARQNGPASFAGAEKVTSKLARQFFFEPICEKRARRKRTVVRTSGWHTVAPFRKYVPHIKVILRIHVQVDTYRRQCEVKGWGRARGYINLIKARILLSTKRRWAHVKIILKARARAQKKK